MNWRKEPAPDIRGRVENAGGEKKRDEQKKEGDNSALGSKGGGYNYGALQAVTR